MLIRTKWGRQIAAACAGTAVPESFLAALVANETGGDQTKTRFESSAFGQMCEVVAGQRAHYQNLGAQDFQLPPAVSMKDGLRILKDYATSRGLTQIMGYQALLFNRSFSVFSDPDEHLKFAVILLVQFANRWDLELPEPNDARNVSDLEKLFACWNCGRPFPEKTFDPHYCANGLLRMNLYPPAPASAVESV